MGIAPLRIGNGSTSSDDLQHLALTNFCYPELVN
jgi:hypothetical protein